jgi:two-component system nitrate/nitrite response regulator NarL
MITRVKTHFPDAKIVILAETFDADAVSAAWGAGAHGFCLSNSQSGILVGSLELVMLGEIVLPAAFVLSMTGPNANHSAPVNGPEAYDDHRQSGRKLSAREAQILSYLREGAPNKLIARKLNLSESTVKVHVKAIGGIIKLGPLRQNCRCRKRTPQFYPHSIDWWCRFGACEAFVPIGNRHSQ